MRACDELDLSRVDSPAYVIDLAMLERNLELLAHAQAAAGATILLALKGFAAWSTFPIVGTSSSTLHRRSIGAGRSSTSTQGK